MTLRVGLDLGNVLTQRRADGLGAFADESFLSVRPAKGAFDCVRQIGSVVGFPNVYVVSRCSEAAEHRARAWLREKTFCATTAVSEANIYFCRERPQKRRVAEQLRLSHFVDDRWSVLKHMVEIPTMMRLYLLNPDGEELNRFIGQGDSRTVLVSSLEEVLTDLATHCRGLTRFAGDEGSS